ncbi:MAG: stage V sporulation protein AB [Lachnospiraceae bacterium]
MWSREILLAVVGVSFGSAVSAGIFAFLTSIGVLTRIIGKTRTASQIQLYENMVILGGTIGTLITVFQVSLPIGSWILVFYGLGAGIYAGSLGMALAEIINAFPILFRRMHLKHGLIFVVPAVAIGKFIGATYYFAMGMWAK